MQRVVDAVLGQDQQRPVGPEPAVEQRLADGVGRPRRLLIGDCRQAPALSRSARKVRLGSAMAQRSSSAPSERGTCPSSRADRSTIEPSLPRSCSTRGGANRLRAPSRLPTSGALALVVAVSPIEIPRSPGPRAPPAQRAGTHSLVTKIVALCNKTAVRGLLLYPLRASPGNDFRARPATARAHSAAWPFRRHRSWRPRGARVPAPVAAVQPAVRRLPASGAARASAGR